MERDAVHRMSSTLAALRLWLASLRGIVGHVRAADPALDGMEKGLASLVDELAATSGREVSSSTAPSPLTPLGGLDILLVDDDSNMREGMMALLDQLGARTRAVATVAAALRAFMEARPDLIISDLELDGEDGADFLREARVLSSAEGRPVPAIALTGSPHDTASPTDACEIQLTKPPSLDEMLGAIRTLTHVGR